MAKPLFRSFAGGELSPHLYGRADLGKFQTGLALCENFIVTAQGPVENRPGFQFVRETKANGVACLIPFQYSTEQSMVLEFSNLCLRFHTAGATLMSGGLPYEIVTPYVEADLFDLHYVQSADVLTIVHPSYAPRELRRVSATNWTLTTVSFVPGIDTPAVPTGGTGGPGGGTPEDYDYVCTALLADTLEESLASAAVTVNIDLSVVGNYAEITPAAVTGAVRYNVYKQKAGVFGYIGQSDGTLFRDDNIVPDMTQTPPIARDPFTSDNPGAVSYHDQRRCFGGSADSPQSIWLTRSGTEANLSYSVPTQDDDAITARIVAREAQTVRHLVPLDDLLALTSGGVWRISGAGGDVMTPSSFKAKPQSYVGASNVQPAASNDSVLYVAHRGAHIREVAYRWETQAYRSEDVSVLAPHLVDFHSIVQLAYSRAPQQLLWAVRDDGVLMGLTHMPEHEVKAWHQHTTQGLFESVCVVPEGDEDGVYVVVSRTVNGGAVRYVERMHSRQFVDLADAFFVDSGLTYSGAAATTISGLDHLEGEEVTILADGGVEPPQTVTGGAITLEAAASTVHVGLAYNCDLTTLPVALEAEAALGTGLVKNVVRAHLRVLNSSAVQVGPSFDRLQEYDQRSVTDDYGSVPAPLSTVIDVTLSPKWAQEGSVCVRQANPLPLTVQSMALEMATGG